MLILITAHLPWNFCHYWTVLTLPSMLSVPPTFRPTYGPLAQCLSTYSAWIYVSLTIPLSSLPFLSNCQSCGWSVSSHTGTLSPWVCLPEPKVINNHLVSDPPPTSVDGLVDHYNTCLMNYLDSKLKSQSVCYNCPAPRFTSELRTMKTAGCRLEQKNYLVVHLEASKDHLRPNKAALERVKTNFYSTPTEYQHNKPRLFFKPAA